MQRGYGPSNMGGVIAIVVGLLLMGALLVLLFSFALLRDREHIRSLSVTDAPHGPATIAPSPMEGGRAQTPKTSGQVTRVGEHYVTGSNPGAVITPAARPPGRTHGGDPGADRGGEGEGSGLTITGFDSAGSKVYLKVSQQMLQRRRWGVTFGRDRTVSDYEVRDSDRYVSRRHFRVRWSASDQCYEIEDLASTSGTILDGQPISPFRFVALRPGSTVKIGQLELDVGRA